MISFCGQLIDDLDSLTPAIHLTKEEGDLGRRISTHDGTTYNIYQVVFACAGLYYPGIDVRVSRFVGMQVYINSTAKALLKLARFYLVN